MHFDYNDDNLFDKLNATEDKIKELIKIARFIETNKDK